MATPSAATDPVAIDTSKPAVVFEHVSIGFGRRLVLDDISFTVENGETRILLGAAGEGKSVLLKIALGLLRPDEGHVLIFGHDITRMSEEQQFALRRHIGMVFQESALFDSMTVEDNVAYRLHQEHDLPEDEVRRRVVQALRFVELENTLSKYPSELSGGMRRRVAIARAIITQPELLLYDSPTGGLDPITSTTIIELLVKQRDVYHSSALMVTHRLQDAFVMATHCFNRKTNRMQPIPDGGTDPNTRFLLLRGGRIVFDGTTLELTHSKDEYIREYIS